MKKRKYLLLFLLCYLSYCSTYVARLNLSVAAPLMIEDGVLNAAVYGLMGSCFSACYACCRLLSGYFSDRIRPAWMIGSGLFIAALSNLLLGFLPPIPAMLVLWSCNALAQALLWGAILRMMAFAVPSEKVSRYTSFMGTSVCAGNILGFLINSFSVSNWGYTFAFFVPGFLCLAFCAFILLSSHDVKPPIIAAKGQVMPKEIFLPRNIAGRLLPAWIHGIMKDNITLWLPMFILTRYRVDVENSTLFLVLVPLVGFFARASYPALSRLVKNDDRIRCGCFLICLASSFLLSTLTGSPLSAALLFGFVYAAVSVINTTFLSIYPLRFPSAIASVSGIMDLLTYLGAAAGSAIYGFVVDRHGFIPMLISWCALSALAALCVLFFGREKNPEAG